MQITTIGLDIAKNVFQILWGGGWRPAPWQSAVATTHSGDGHASYS